MRQKVVLLLLFLLSGLGILYYMNTLTLSPVSFTAKGQLVIPVQLRRMFGITQKTRAIIKPTPEGILIQPMSKSSIDAGCGILNNGKPEAAAKARALYKIEEEKVEERRARRCIG